MDEIWNEVPGYPGCSASSLGRFMGKRGRPTFGSADKNGYRVVTVSVGGKVKGLKVHRAVLMAFGHQMEGLQANHKNGIRHDNRIENLEPCTQSENMLHRHRILGLSWVGKPRAKGEQAAKAKLKETDVIKIRSRFDAGERVCDILKDYPSMGYRGLSMVAQRVNWKHLP